MLSSRSTRLAWRTLHNGKGWPPCVQSQSRLYSQLLRHNGSCARPSLAAAKTSSRLQRTSVLLHFHRYASTAPETVQTTPLAGSGAADVGSASTSEWDALLEEASSRHAGNMEPHIGWLKELGLDFGWGPTAFMETMLEYIHVFGGMPWWVSVAALSIGFRLALVRLHVRAADHSGRLTQMSGEIKPLQEKMTTMRAANDTAGLTAATQELRATMKAAGVKHSAIFVPIVIQGFLGFGMFRLMNRMTHLPVPGLEHGGLLWFADFTHADPFFVLPVATGALMWWGIKRGGETGSVNINPAALKLMLYFIPGVTTIVFATMPAGMQYVALMSALWSVLQGTLLRYPAFRAWAGIVPLPENRNLLKPEGPYKGTVNTYRTPDEIAKSHTLAERWKRVKQPASDYLKTQMKSKKSTRIGARDIDKARQYEKERRAEIEAARERFLEGKRKREGNGK